jgi:hypothetical protein
MNFHALNDPKDHEASVNRTRSRIPCIRATTNPVISCDFVRKIRCGETIAKCTLWFCYTMRCGPREQLRATWTYDCTNIRNKYFNYTILR